jgi:hypothetical protein
MSRNLRHSLRLKLALSFALAGLVLVLVHAVAIHQLNRQQEAQLIDQIVSDEMEGLLEQYERQGRLDGPPYRALQRYQVRPDTEALSLRKWFRASWLVQGFVARDDAERAELPVELRGLEPGFHDVGRGQTAIAWRYARSAASPSSSPIRYRCTKSADSTSRGLWCSAR